MSWKDIFKDSNDYNEKTIIAFLSFLVASILAFASLYTGKPLSGEAFFGFLGLTAAGLGIEGLVRIFRKNESR